MSEQQTSDSSPHEPLPDFVRRRHLPVVTLDHNSILGYFKVEDGDPDATEKNQDDARALATLFALHQAWVIRLLVPAATMLENQPAGKDIDIQEWARRLAPLGFDSQDILPGCCLFPYPRLTTPKPKLTGLSMTGTFSIGSTIFSTKVAVHRRRT
jgi:hypothetical protein